MSGSRVEIDTSAFDRGVRQLAAGLNRQGARVGMTQASATAARIAGRVPVLTGALRATVATVRETDGAGVTYGGDLPYADYIENRSHAVEDGLNGAEEAFAARMWNAASQEVRSV